MKHFKIRDLYNAKFQEYILGSKETGRHSVYLVYGELSANEKREMAPDGHDEILFLLSGDAILETPELGMTLSQEQAVSMDPDGFYKFRALSDCRYIVAGTHIVPHHHRTVP